MKNFKIVIDGDREYGPYELDMAKIVEREFEEEGINPDVIEIVKVNEDDDEEDQLVEGYRVVVDGVVDEDFGETHHYEEAVEHVRWLEREDGINPDIIKIETLDWSDDEDDEHVEIDYDDPKQTGELDTSDWDDGDWFYYDDDGKKVMCDK